MNIYEAIRQENARILKIMRQLEDTAAHQPEKREELLRLAHNHLAAQKTVEENRFYPLLLASPKTFEAVARARHENEEIDNVLDQLALMDKSDPDCRYLLEYLSGLVQRHIEWEEHALFRQASQVISPEQADLLGEVAAREQEVLRHLFQESQG
jgi:hemerythrin-like domain-containing protein